VQDGDELGWVEKTEIEALESHVEGEFVERVGSGVEDAGVPAGGFQPPGRGRAVPGDVFDGSVVCRLIATATASSSSSSSGGRAAPVPSR